MMSGPVVLSSADTLASVLGFHLRRRSSRR
jgi:hypothetical protein